MENMTTDELAQILWDFNTFKQPLEKVDAILLLGNFDIRTAEYAAEVYKAGYAPLLLITGNKSVSNINLWDRPEADIFAEEVKKLGVPESALLLEKSATNSGENILFTKALVEERGLDITSFIVIHKPFMLRRAYATFMKQWPGKELIMSAPDIPFSQYPTKELSKEYIINIMIGDTQRLKIYAEKGFQIPQDIPQKVWDAWQELVRRGFTAHLIEAPK